MDTRDTHTLIRENAITVAIVLAAAYWIFEALLHKFIFVHKNFHNIWLPSDPNELWSRSAVCIFFILFGVYSKMKFRQHRHTQAQLAESEAKYREVADKLRETAGKLEQRVREQTVDLSKTVEVLQNEVLARIAAEKSLRESEEYNRELFEQSPIGLALCNMDGQLVDVNPAYAKIIGRSIEETLLLTYWDITPKKYTPQEQMQLESLNKTGRYGPYEKEYIHKDGHLVPVRLSGRIIERQEKQFIWSSIEDITNRKQAEEALQKAYGELEMRVEERTAELKKLNDSLELEIIEHNKAQEQLQLIRFSIDHANVEYFWIGRDAEILFVNDYACKVLGYSREELLKMLVCDIDPNYPAPKWPGQWEELKRLGSKTFETIHRTKDGRDIPVELTVHYLDFNGREYHFAFAQDISERRTSEDKIRNLAKIPSENPYPIIRVDWDGKVLYANEVSEPYLAEWGMEIGAIVPENIRRIMHNAVDTCVKQEIELTHSGQIFSFVVAPIMDGYYCNFYGSDITESKRAEEEIRAREMQFRTLVEASPNALLLVAADGTIKLVNRQAETLFGYRRKELVGQLIEILVPERFRRRHPHLRATYTSEPQTRMLGVGRDLFAVRKDGTEVPVEIGLSPIETPEGSFTMATVIDITKRKQAEEQLRKVNQSLRTLSQCNEIMVRATEEQNFLNGVCTSIVAYGGYRLVWVGFAEENEKGVELVRPAAHAGYEDGYLKAVEIRWDDSELGRGPGGTAIRTGKPCICGNIPDDPMYAPWRDEAARRGYVSTMALPLIDSGTTLGALSIYSPQPNAFETEEIQLLTELANDMAYGIKAIRTRKEREKAEAASQRLNRELVRKNKELESIIFVASHDLRSALVNVQGFSRELGMTCDTVRNTLLNKNISRALRGQLQKPLEEDIPEMVEFITSSTARIDALLNGLLRLSRVGREEMKVAGLDMNAIMAEIMRSMQFKIAQANARIEAGPLPPCMGDHTLISQAFSNLIDNSIKFLDRTRQGLIRISAKIEGGQSVYCIEDNGVGIAPNYQGKVFEVFQRLVPEETPGEGLGLTIVRQIVERHNGRVWVESEPGKGSRFFVSLPSA